MTDFQQIFLRICLFFRLFDDACHAAAKNFNKMRFATLFLENFVVEYVQTAGYNNTVRCCGVKYEKR